MFVNVTGFSIMTGLLTALDSLGSQAYGSKRFRLVGVLAQRGFLCCCVLAVPVAALWIFAEPLMVLLKMSPEVSRLTGLFAKWMLPGLLPYALIEVIKRYLQARSLSALDESGRCGALNGFVGFEFGFEVECLSVFMCLWTLKCLCGDRCRTLCAPSSHLPPSLLG